MLSWRQLVTGNSEPPEAGLYVTRQRGLAAVRTSHFLQHLPDLDQHQLLLAHAPKTLGAPSLPGESFPRFDERLDRPLQPSPEIAVGAATLSSRAVW